MNKFLTNNYLNGYSVLDVFTKKDISNLEKKIIIKINKKINKSTQFKKGLKNLKYFHNIPFTKIQKSKIFEAKDRFINLDTGILRQIKRNKQINNILKDQWGHNKYKVMWVASLKKKQIKKKCLWI